MLRSISHALAAILATSAFAGLAHSESASFCNIDEANCVEAQIENVAAVTVTSVIITQEQGKKSCEGGVEKTISQNLKGGTKLTPGDKATFYANSICKYKLKFKTTNGCSGDKTTHIKPSNFYQNEKVAKLTGGCGTLKATTTHKNSSFE